MFQNAGMDLAAELLNLLVPTQCHGCGRWDTTLCSTCAALAYGVPQPWELEAEVPLSGWALGQYANELRDLVLAAKHRRWVRLDGWLEAAGWNLGQELVREGALAGRHPPSLRVRASPTEPTPPLSLSSHQLAPRVSVVPIPSGWRRQWNGMLITPTIATGVTTALRAGGITAELVPALRLGWFEHSQRGGTKGQRRHLRPMTLQTAVSGAVVLVDDVVTTGTTLLSALAALPESVESVRAVTLARA